MAPLVSHAQQGPQRDGVCDELSRSPDLLGREVLLPHLPQGSELQYRAEPFQFRVQYLMPL